MQVTSLLNSFTVGRARAVKTIERINFFTARPIKEPPYADNSRIYAKKGAGNAEKNARERKFKILFTNGAGNADKIRKEDNCKRRTVA